MIAADQVNRICLATEIEPHYCQHIILRYKRHCEKQGQAFEFEHINGGDNPLTIEAIEGTVTSSEDTNEE